MLDRLPMLVIQARIVPTSISWEIYNTILSLVDRSVVGADEARDVVSIAIDATEEIASELAIRPASLQHSISLLANIKHSLPVAM